MIEAVACIFVIGFVGFMVAAAWVGRRIYRDHPPTDDPARDSLWAVLFTPRVVPIRVEVRDVTEKR